MKELQGKAHTSICVWWQTTWHSLC